jgi:cephalosporin hydroxylase
MPDRATTTPSATTATSSAAIAERHGGSIVLALTGLNQNKEEMMEVPEGWEGSVVEVEIDIRLWDEARRRAQAVEISVQEYIEQALEFAFQAEDLPDEQRPAA